VRRGVTAGAGASSFEVEVADVCAGDVLDVHFESPAQPVFQPLSIAASRSAFAGCVAVAEGSPSRSIAAREPDNGAPSFSSTKPEK
jgi:hypothetical protein